MVSDLGVFGEDWEAMAMISEKGTKLRMRSGERLWNEEGGGAFRFKSTHRAPNTQERNICTEMIVAREDETERARSQAGRPRRGRPAPPCQVLAPVFWKFLLIPSSFGYLGALVQKRKERIEGKRTKGSILRYGTACTICSASSIMSGPKSCFSTI